MTPNRRSLLALMGMTPLAAKAAVDTEIAKAAGVTVNGIGNVGLGLPYVGGLPSEDGAAYEKRLIGAADYVKLFGVPEVMDYEARDRARYVAQLDPDIACKASWSMAVKIMTQRQRNYAREIERIERTGWVQRGRMTLKNLMGFDWPW